MEGKQVRLNSEKTISNDNFKIKIGTTNKANPLVVYVEGRAFIRPSRDKEDYSKDIVDIKRQFSRTIQENLLNNKLFTEKYILDFQVAQNGISVSKKSFLSFQFLLKQRSDKKIMKLKDIKNASEDMINNIVNDFSNNIEKHDFEITKTKR